MANFPMVSMYLMKRKPKKRVNVKAIPRLIITSKDGEIEIRPYSIIIRGTMESAALALAEDILKRIPRDAPYNARELYINAFDVTKDAGKDSKYILNLLRPDAMNADSWAALKKDVEKICNNLAVFMQIIQIRAKTKLRQMNRCRHQFSEQLAQVHQIHW